TGCAGCPHDNLDIALAVEGADVAGVAVIVHDVVEVGGLGPANTFEVDGEGRPGRPAGHVHRQCGRLDPIGADFFLVPGVDPQAVGSAKIIGRCEAEFGPSGAVRAALRNGLGNFLPTLAGHAIADDPGPVELIALARLQTFAANQSWLADAGEWRCRYQFALR